MQVEHQRSKLDQRFGTDITTRDVDIAALILVFVVVIQNSERNAKLEHF